MSSTPNAEDPPKPEQPTPPAPAKRHSGEGADSALEALKKRRVPAPRPPTDTPGP